MNEKLFRTQFNQMETTEKQALMESLAARYTMTFLGLHTFDRWGQNCTTGIFEKDGREFVFVPGDTVTLGWERFAVGLNQKSRRDSLTLVGRARFEREGDGWQASLYHEVDYPDFQKLLEQQGLSLPTADEWAYLCGGGCRTLFPWGDGLDYSMRLRWFEDMDEEDGDRPYDMEEPNFFGLSIAFDPYMRGGVNLSMQTGALDG